MRTIRTLIIDDEEIPRKWLHLALENHFPELTIVDVYDSVASGLEGIKEHNPELVFLDIELQDGNAFNLLDQLRDIRFKIIFTTAHEEYALKAIKMSALDYLVKPVLIEDLTAAINRFRKLPDSEAVSRVLTDHMGGKNTQESKIVLPTQEGYEFVRIADIVYCQADGNYTVFQFTNRTCKIICRTLKEYDDLLSDYDFHRIHQSYLINIHHAVKYIRTQQAQIEMSNGDTLNISRSKKDEFIRYLKHNSETV